MNSTPSLRCRTCPRCPKTRSIIEVEESGETRLIQAVQAAELRGRFGAEYVRSFLTEEVA